MSADFNPGVLRSTRFPDRAARKPAGVLVDGVETLDNDFELHYTDEFSVRRGLARLAYAYGWAVVREEVVIPGWGRVDLLLQETDEDDWPYLIEIKLDLSRPSTIRRAYQQADGYGRWWEQTHGGGSYPILAAVTIDVDHMNSIGSVYPSVQWRTVSSMTRLLCGLGDDCAGRKVRAAARLAQVEAELVLHRAALTLATCAAYTQTRRRGEATS